MYFCRSWFSNMISFRYVLVFLKFLHNIFSIKSYTISFLCKRNFFIDEKHTQWILDTKEKVVHESISCFMKWSSNCISWNTVYPTLKGFSLKPIKGFCLEGENPTLNELKYKVCVLNCACWIFHFRFGFFFIKAYLFVQKTGLLDFKFFFIKAYLFVQKTGLFDFKTLYNSFQNQNNIKITHAFPPRPMTFKLQQKGLEFNDICMSWSSQKTDLEPIF